MDRLWSPWRLEYVTRGDTQTGCIFCPADASAEAAQRESLIVFRGTTCHIILNLYPYNNGHVMVVPYRHTASFATLSREELHEMADLVQRSETALHAAYHPHGLNVGVNLGTPAGAGVLEHVHMHMVPRWNGDTNFMTVIGETRVLPEELQSSARKLRPIFEKLNVPR